MASQKTHSGTPGEWTCLDSNSVKRTNKSGVAKDGREEEEVEKEAEDVDEIQMQSRFLRRPHSR